MDLPAGFATLASRGRWIPAPHLLALSHYLNEQWCRRIRRMLVMMPVRHGKSEQINRYGTPCYLRRFPDHRVMLVSHQSTYAATWGLKARDVMVSQPDLTGLTLREDSAAVADWNIQGHEGGFTTTGAGGVPTGRGANWLIVDDPIKDQEEAFSDGQRNKLWEWWNGTLLPRLEPDGIVTLIMTRWHEDDIAGRLLREMQQGGDQWFVLRLPALADEDEAYPYFRRVRGEALWEARWPKSQLEQIRATRPAYWWAATYQQQPVPLGGAMFKEVWWRWIPAHPTQVVARCRFWDTAATEKHHDNEPDYTVGTLMAKTVEGRYVIEDVKRGQWSPANVDQMMLATARQDGTAVRVREEQEPGASGKAVIAARAKLVAGYDYRGVPADAAKTTRWRPFAAQAEVGNVDVVVGLWNRDWLGELNRVPAGLHDDQADSAAGAFNELALGPQPPSVKVTGLSIEQTSGWTGGQL